MTPVLQFLGFHLQSLIIIGDQISYCNVVQIESAHQRQKSSLKISADNVLIFRPQNGTLQNTFIHLYKSLPLCTSFLSDKYSTKCRYQILGHMLETIFSISTDIILRSGAFFYIRLMIAYNLYIIIYSYERKKYQFSS